MIKDISIYTKERGKNVAKRARGTVGKYHVIPTKIHKWSVVAEGNVKPVKAFSTKNAAIVFAKRYALLKGLNEVAVHGTDGRIAERISY